MTQIRNFDKSFVRRTKANLKDYRGEYDMCNLLNCTLGLIVLPYELANRGRAFNRNPVWNRDINTIRQLQFNYLYFNPQGFDNRRNVITLPSTLKNFLNKLRNGIAHQRISPINNFRINPLTEKQELKFDEVQIQNSFPVGNVIDLDVRFSQQQLSRFAIFIVNRNLET